MPVGSSTVLFAFSLARSILRDRHYTKDCVEQGPKGFEFHRFPGKKVSGNTTIRNNEHLSCTKRASWRTYFAEDQEPKIPLCILTYDSKYGIFMSNEHEYIYQQLYAHTFYKGVYMCVQFFLALDYVSIVF